MAAAKKKASKKAVKKPTRKAQNAAKASKAAKGKKKAGTPQDSTGSITSGSLNPYRVGGSYWASVEALESLGVGKMHPFAEIVPAVKKAMGEGWKSFADKAARSEKTGKDAADRILQNVSVVARQDYAPSARLRGSVERAGETGWAVQGRQRVIARQPNIGKTPQH